MKNKKNKKISKLTKKQVDKVEKLNTKIDELELDAMSETEIERTVSSFSKEGMDLRAKRKKIRYQLYRLRTEAEGKNSAGSTKKFEQQFETQPGFEGWRMFGTTWDVAFDDPTRIVHKTISEQEEWDEVIRAKFPSIDSSGRVTYPDINVRKKVEKHLKSKE